MVTFGGDDAKNMTPKILAFLNDEYPNLIKNVIIGRAFQNIDDIKKYTDKNTNLIYYPDAEKMKEIMFESDIAISACGQTLNELASVGVPTIGVCTAGNQLGNVKGWQKAGFIKYCGLWKNDRLLKNIIDSKDNIENKMQRKIIFEIVKNLLDGRGAKRLIRKFISWKSKGDKKWKKKLKIS